MNANNPRVITTHRADDGDLTRLLVMDEPGPGGAHHHYLIDAGNDEDDSVLGSIEFQLGPIAEAGINGVQIEHLLAVAIDRLECFQAGPFASPYNANALKFCGEALAALQRRTRDRLARGVEGKNAE